MDGDPSLKVNDRVLKEVKAMNVYFTHQGAENIVEGFAEKIDDYSVKWGRLADKAWQENYQEKEIYSREGDMFSP